MFSKKILHTLNVVDYGLVHTLAFSLDSSILAFGLGKVLVLCDLIKHREMFKIAHQGIIPAISFSTINEETVIAVSSKNEKNTKYI